MDKSYPDSSLIGGWFIFIFGLAQVFIWGIWLQSQRSVDEKNKSSSVCYLFTPDPAWGPKSAKTRREWIAFKTEKREKRKVQSNGHSQVKQMGWALMGKYQ